MDRHPAIPRPGIQETHHPRRRRLRERAPARDHRVQEPHDRRRLEIRSGSATPPLPGTRLTLEEPGSAEALRNGPDSRRNLRRARRLRHGRHPGAVLPRVEGALPANPRPTGSPPRTPPEAPGHPPLRTPRTPEPPRHRP